MNQLFGEPDIAVVASAIADPRRARVLMALADGRALPAGRLAEEAGVAASTASSHLALLLDRGLATVEQEGRRRYYRLASAEVERVLESLAALAPRLPITSLRAHTRAGALRTARTCYQHLAGRLGVALFGSLISNGWVSGGDGLHRPNSVDQLSAPGRAVDYRLTSSGASGLTRWGIAAELAHPDLALRYCVDWTEQAHHLGGPTGRAIASRMGELGWTQPGRVARSLQLTDAGRRGLAAHFGVADLAVSA